MANISQLNEAIKHTIFIVGFYNKLPKNVDRFVETYSHIMKVYFPKAKIDRENAHQFEIAFFDLFVKALKKCGFAESQWAKNNGMEKYFKQLIALN